VSAKLNEAIEQFNRGAYFDAAELFEHAAAQADDLGKKFAIALNRIATGCHLRFERGTRQAAINLFSQAMLTLDQLKPSRDGVDIETLLAELHAYTEEIRATPKGESEGMKHRARMFLERRRVPKIKRI
jgi:hypothetical protein